MKRKAPAHQSPAKRSKRTNNSSTLESSLTSASPKPVANSEQPFRFLDLAAELRTEILSLVARHGGTALLKRNSGGVVSSVDPVSFANKQIHEEYLGVLYQHALTTFAYVLDFDFRHVVTYFNKLNAAEVKALPTKATRPAKRPLLAVSVAQRRGTSRLLKHTIPAHFKTSDTTALQPILAPRTLKILLDFTPMCRCESTHLLRWLKRFDAVNKIGSKVRIDYGAVSMGAVSHWGNLETLTWRVSPDGPLEEAQAAEMKKIRDAASSAISQVKMHKAAKASP